MEKKQEEKLKKLQEDIRLLEETHKNIEAKLCEAQTMHNRAFSACKIKEEELKELEKKIGLFVSYEAFDKFFSDKKNEVEIMDKEIEDKKKESDSFVSNLEKEKIDHQRSLDEMSKKIQSERNAFDVYILSKNKELEEREKDIGDKEKYIDIEIGLMSSEKEEIERQKQVSSIMYIEAQKIQEKSQQTINDYECKFAELENVKLEVIEKSKELSSKNQEYTDKNNLLTKTLSEKILLKEENEKKRNELDTAMQETLKKGKQYDELLKIVEERNYIVSEQESILNDQREKQEQRESIIANKEKAIKGRENELTHQEADYRAKYNQFLLTLKLKGLKLSELQ